MAVWPRALLLVIPTFIVAISWSWYKQRSQDLSAEEVASENASVTSVSEVEPAIIAITAKPVQSEIKTKPESIPDVTEAIVASEKPSVEDTTDICPEISQGETDMACEEAIAVQRSSVEGAGAATEQQKAKLEALGDKLSSLSLNEKDTAAIKDRDSANHSPADFSHHSQHSSQSCDARSEGSNDSGKGGSHAEAENEGPASYDPLSPPLTPPNPAERLFLYEFEIPQHLCGLLIGRYGAHVNLIKSKTGASLLIKKHPENRKLKLCSIEGTKTEIDAALAMIRAKFPVKRYPALTLAQTNIAQPTLALLPESVQLHLPAEVTCEIIVSSIVSGGHCFLQQPTHPTYSSLSRLDMCMAHCYSQYTAPTLPSPIQPGMVCAAPTLGGWYRAKVVAVHPAETVPTLPERELEDGEIVDDEEEDLEPKEAVRNSSESKDEGQNSGSSTSAEEPKVSDVEVDICFVDYGGYAKLPVAALRQVRADFMSLPFQAVECLLANVAPLSAEEGWSLEASAVLQELTQGWVLQAQLIAYTEDGLPLVNLFQVDSDHVVDINRELVARGVALWVEPDIVVPSV